MRGAERAQASWAALWLPSRSRRRGERWYLMESYFDGPMVCEEVFLPLHWGGGPGVAGRRWVGEVLRTGKPTRLPQLPDLFGGPDGASWRSAARCRAAIAGNRLGDKMYAAWEDWPSGEFLGWSPVSSLEEVRRTNCRCARRGMGRLPSLEVERLVRAAALGREL